ncbi:MAG: ATP-binding protein [Cohaesibacter sp.]|nr:ATP-binding protein [Cohaesibacter sp.]
MAERVLRSADLASAHSRVLMIAAIFLAIAVMIAGILAYRFALFANTDQAQARLTLQVQALANSLEKYRLLAPLAARRPDVLAILSNQPGWEGKDAALLTVSQLGVMSSAVEIELTYLSGDRFLVLDNQLVPASASNGVRGFRSDIVDAFQGRLGRRLPAEKDGQIYIFSSPVRFDGVLVGALSVHVDMSETEENWALSAEPIIAVDATNRVILSNRDGWYGADFRLVEQARGKADTGKTETGKTETGKDVRLMADFSLFGPALVSVFGKRQKQRFVAAMHIDPLLGWTFYALEPLRKPALVAVSVGMGVAMVGGFLLGWLWVAFNRQQLQLTQRRRDKASALWLERRVRDRTKELRQTQAGLIHSAKLAAIGQMSAVLSHEYNQPLSAIRSYAENAQLLFEAGKSEQGSDNLVRISKLVDRLAKLSRNLKSFARRPGVDTKPVCVAVIVDEAMMLMMPQARKCGVEIVALSQDKDLNVLAGHTRLEQVLINLMSNALDAFVEAGLANGRIQIESFAKGEMGIIRVSDTGVGVDDALRHDIFEPFVTSKDHGHGLGLGLPIAFNLIKGFGGDLILIESPDPAFKTCFEICLPLAK